MRSNKWITGDINLKGICPNCSRSWLGPIVQPVTGVQSIECPDHDQKLFRELYYPAVKMEFPKEEAQLRSDTPYIGIGCPHCEVWWTLRPAWVIRRISPSGAEYIVMQSKAFYQEQLVDFLRDDRTEDIMVTWRGGDHQLVLGKTWQGADTAPINVWATHLAKRDKKINPIRGPVLLFDNFRTR